MSSPYERLYLAIYHLNECLFNSGGRRDTPEVKEAWGELESRFDAAQEHFEATGVVEETEMEFVGY